MLLNVRDVESELRMRDERDATRSISPSKPADDVVLIDTTQLDVAGVLNTVLSCCREFKMANQ